MSQPQLFIAHCKSRMQVYRHAILIKIATLHFAHTGHLKEYSIAKRLSHEREDICQEWNSKNGINRVLERLVVYIQLDRGLPVVKRKGYLWSREKATLARHFRRFQLSIYKNFKASQ